MDWLLFAVVCNEEDSDDTPEDVIEEGSDDTLEDGFEVDSTVGAFLKIFLPI